jgi:lysophospholipase L1-like esterase
MFSRSTILKIATFGDSLTQGNPPPNCEHPGTYQNFMVKIIEKEGWKVYSVNWGIGGQLMGQISERVPQALPVDIISITGGTNDVWRFSNFDEEMSREVREGIIEEMNRAIDFVLNGPNGNKTKIILCSTPPILPSIAASKAASDNVIKLRPMIEALAKKRNVYYCDIFAAMQDQNGRARKELVNPDGVHFKQEGNKAFGEALGKKILEILNEKC